MKNKKIKNKLWEFFRPSIWIWMIFVFLFGVIILNSFMMMVYDFTGEMVREGSPVIQRMLILVDDNAFGESVPKIIPLLIDFIYLYLLSCIIVFLIKSSIQIAKKGKNRK